MDKQNIPQSGQQIPEASAAAGVGEAARRTGRRRLLKGGAAAAPVLLSLGSKPAMATTLPCSHHKSGWASAGSRTKVNNGDHTSHSQGCTPDYWKRTGVTWPTGCSKSSTLFVTCFGSVPAGCDSRYYKLYDGLSHSDELVRHFAASYLNCKAGKYGTGTIMTEANVKSWWTVCQANGEATINTDGKLRKQASYWKSQELYSPDARTGGFLNLMKTINTVS